jgi:hypothetical protein
MLKKQPSQDQHTIPVQLIERRIYLIRDHKVMLDSDLSELYQVPTKRLNEAVKRNAQRFPEDFMLQLTSEEAEALRSQIATSNEQRGGRRYLPYVFTEQGVAMLSSVLNSERAIHVNIAIMRAFVNLRQLLATNKDVASKLEKMEQTQKEHGAHINAIWKAIQKLIDPQPRPNPVLAFASRMNNLFQSQTF